MKTKTILAASAAILMSVSPAFAQTYTSAERNTTLQEEAAAKQIRAALLDRSFDSGTTTFISVDERRTADGMIGATVYNTSGERLATIDDIIVSESGEATTVVLSEGGFMGIGDKLAAFDYGQVTSIDRDGDVIMPLSEEIIKQAYVYSYDTDDAGDRNTRIMPATSRRLSKLLDADVVDAEGADVADVDNVTLRNGKAEYLLLGVGETLEMGGKTAAMPYADLNIASAADEKIDVRLTADQARRLQSFIRTNISSR